MSIASNPDISTFNSARRGQGKDVHSSINSLNKYLSSVLGAGEPAVNEPGEVSSFLESTF